MENDLTEILNISLMGCELPPRYMSMGSYQVCGAIIALHGNQNKGAGILSAQIA